MKRTIHILKDATGLLGTALILALALFMTSRASAQDIYEIEQTFDQPFNSLLIDQGWDARLMQAPEGSPTTVVLRTRCAEFFEEGNEPNIIKAKSVGKKHGDLRLSENTLMPRSTVVEIHTAQPINDIHLYKGARLTIEQYDFDSVDLDISADTGALLVIDTMSNLGNTHISLYNATLDLDRGHIKVLNIWAHGNSVVKKGKLWAVNQRLYLSNDAVSNVTASDSATHLYVDRKRWLNKTDKLRSLSLTFGLDFSMPITGTDGARYGSPYNTYSDLGAFWQFTTNAIPLGGHWSLTPGFQFGYHVVQLDNIVKTESNHLVLDDSYGANAPRQALGYTTIGLPVTLNYSFSKAWHAFSQGFFFKLTPMFYSKQTLGTQTLNEHNHWTYKGDKGLDVLNRFNLRAAVGLHTGLLGIRNIEFFIDLLPSYKASAGAPQTRMMGLVYHF